MTIESQSTIRTFSGKQLLELKKLFADHQILHLGIIDEDGSVIVEYEEITWLTDDAEQWHNPPLFTTKTLIINR